MSYFKSPNYIFDDLRITPIAKLILLYFCRRANKSGRSFPSIKRICRDTGIKSQTSVHKYTDELIKNNLISMIPRGKNHKSNRYQLCEDVVSKVRNNKYSKKISRPEKDDSLLNKSCKHTPNFDSMSIQNLDTKENTKKENLDISISDTTDTVLAERLLNDIREKNKTQRPKIYENKLDPFDM